jgi:hypothetical protein
MGPLLNNLYALAVARAPQPLAPLLRPRLLTKNRKENLRSQAERRRTVSRQGQDITNTHFSWYRGEHSNFGPTKVNLWERDAIDRYILSGWLPKEPFISKQTPVVAFGSCFAGHISHYLRDRGYNLLGKGLGKKAYIIRCGEGMVNSFAIRQQFEWAFEGRAFKEGFWHDKTGTLLKPEDQVREETLSIFRGADVFILTLGLSEVWYDKENGDVFWRAIPSDSFDPQKHGFRVSTVAENLDNLRTIVGLIRKHRPGAKLVLTLSPVPLVATFRPVSCVSANSVSKSILRVAIDELMREGIEDVHYFPSYEIVTTYFQDAYKLDNRHVARHYVRKPG